MQDLRVIGTEDGALLVSDDDGTRYRLPVDDVLQLKMRQVSPSPSIGERLAPKDIQAYIRSGMSAEDVATITGAPLEHIQRFEGPVLAEREYVVTSALAVPVHSALETDPLGDGATFGSAVEARLADLGASGERWASWKDATTGWIVKLSFTANQIDHDARWHYDPKKSALDPMNNEAITLSQQGEATGALIPRLRAVQHDDHQQESTRFDSGAFDLARAEVPNPNDRVEDTARNITKPLPDDVAPMNQTADLLDALRRRRGEREAASYDEDPFEEAQSRFAPVAPDGVSNATMRIVEVPLDLPDGSMDAPSDSDIGSRPAVPNAGSPASVRNTGSQPSARNTGSQPSARNTGGQPRVRKGRTAMPTWDEIVFGARPDDDLA